MTYTIILKAFNYKGLFYYHASPIIIDIYEQLLYAYLKSSLKIISKLKLKEANMNEVLTILLISLAIVAMSYLIFKIYLFFKYCPGSGKYLCIRYDEKQTKQAVLSNIPEKYIYARVKNSKRGCFYSKVYDIEYWCK